MNIRISFSVLFNVLIMSFLTYGQSSLDYQMPHSDILKLADVSPAPLVRINASGTTAVLFFRSNYKSIEELSGEELRLGGLRINPATNSPSRETSYHDIKITDVNLGKTHDVIGLPEKPKIARIQWNNAQTKIAFTHTTDSGNELWVLDLATRTASKIMDARLNCNIGSPFVWTPDDNALLVKLLPSDRKPLIERSRSIPSGPVISQNDGQKAQNRTYQDLLRNKEDEANFEQLVRSELHTVSLTGESKFWKATDMYAGFSYSPDGNYLMVTTIERPFSYIVPVSRFPMAFRMYDPAGNMIKEIAKNPLMEEMPKGFMAVSKLPRSFQWRSDKPATLVWVEALDGGDPEQKVDFRDAVYEQRAPFTETPRLIVKTKDRFASIIWGNDELAVLNDYWWNTRMQRATVINPSQNEKPGVVFWEGSSDDKYADPGDFVTARNQFGNYVLEIDKGSLYLMGDGFTPKGKFPFVDKYEIKSQKKKRIYESKYTDKLETLLSAIDIKKGIILTRLESKNEYPNIYLANILKNEIKPITQNPNPFEILNQVHKEVITYKRPDGVELSATLYLPVGYDRTKKEKVPMLMWAYPKEFKDKDNAGQVTTSPNEFTFLYYGSPIYWVARGYAVLDDASFPIIGEGDKEPNDNFIEQLVANAKAAIDAVDAMGYIDRNRVAVGGHSYGAFMTANLLTHSNLFAAGIARSGAYNRTLTPFGFQSEERNYWEAPEVYHDMSPFTHADKMKTPLLLIHGEDDNNSGTFPMQSERYFNALKGLGATTRYVVLPKESHGYSAKESIMHMLWEQDQWLEKYVKNRILP